MTKRKDKVQIALQAGLDAVQASQNVWNDFVDTIELLGYTIESHADSNHLDVVKAQ